MYDKYYYDLNQIRVQVTNVFDRMNNNLIDEGCKVLDYFDDIDRDMAEKHLYQWLADLKQKFHHKLLLEKLALYVIEDPDVFYDYYGFVRSDDFSRLSTIKVFCQMFDKQYPLSYILDVICSILTKD